MMKIKTYKSDSVSRALAQIRKELGPGAVILNTKRSVTKRFFGLVPTLSYEITVAADRGGSTVEDPAETSPSVGLAVEKKIRSYEMEDSSADESAGGSSQRKIRQSQVPSSEQRSLSKHWTRQVEKLSSEVAELKSLLQHPKRPFSAALQSQILSEPFQKLLWEETGDRFDSERIALISAEFVKLVNRGLDENLAVLLNRGVSRDLPSGNDLESQLRSRLNQALSEMIHVSSVNPASGSEGGVTVFIGPTGVGKTTTIAKLAARFALNEGRRVRLLTLDTFRIAAAEQLKIYGEIIGVPVRVIYSVDELDEVLGNRRAEDCILVDTAGLSHRRISECTQLAEYLSGNDTIRKQLVVSATTNAEDLQEAVNSFDVFSPDGLIFTKIDESSKCGVIVNELIRTKKPLTCLTNGQNVPDDLIIPSSETLANMVVPIQ